METLQLNKIQDDILKGDDIDQILPLLRDAVRRKLSENGATSSVDDARGKTPQLSLEDENKDSGVAALECLFALAAWETSATASTDAARLAADVQLLEQCVMQSASGTVPFALGAAWLSLKTRPGASRDEMNDAQQLLERYLTQFAAAATREAAKVDGQRQQKYAFLVELLTIRVLPALGLVESALSFLSKENIRGDLLAEGDRARLENLVKSSTSATTKVKTIPVTAEEAKEPAPQPIAVATPPAQQLVEEFERQRRQVLHRQQEEERQQMIKTAVMTVACVIVATVVVSERKRLARIVTAFGDALFGGE